MKRLSPINIPGLTATVAPVSELLEAGVKRWRLYSDDLDAPLWGTRAAPNVDGRTLETRVEALRILLTEGQFISRRSAARCLGIPTPPPPSWEKPLLKHGRGLPKRLLVAGEVPTNPLLEVGAIRPRRAPMRAGLSWHQLRPNVLKEMPAAPHWLPAPEDVWALLGAVCSVDDLIVAGDHLISTTRRSEGAKCTLEQLTCAADRFTGCVGVGKLRVALPQVRAEVASPAETWCRLLIVRAGLPEPVTNCSVPVEGRVLHADLGYPQWRIAIEYDGAYHFEGGARQAKFDNDRHERMRDAGWYVLVVTSIDQERPQGFLARLARAIERAQLG